MLALLTTFGIEQIEVSNIVNNIFQRGGLLTIAGTCRALGAIALTFYFVTKIVAVYSGSEQITPKLFGPPLFYALILMNWNTLNTQIDEGLKSIQNEFQTATPKDSRSTEAYQKIIQNWSGVPSSGNPPVMTPSGAEQESTWFNLDKIKNMMADIVTVINSPEILILKVIMFCTHAFNTIILMLFNAFTYVWINLLRIGGSIALALYFFPTFKGTFTNWLRTYISVYLWIPIGSIMIYVSDQIFLEIVNRIGDVKMPMSGVGLDPDSLMKMTFLVISAMATTILKLILLSKVPTIIGYWLGGGNSGDMFSAAPTMVMMSTSAATSVVSGAGQAASSALSGGASAAGGSASGSLKG